MVFGIRRTIVQDLYRVKQFSFSIKRTQKNVKKRTCSFGTRQCISYDIILSQDEVNGSNKEKNVQSRVRQICLIIFGKDI